MRYGIKKMRRNQQHCIDFGPGIHQRPAPLLTVAEVADRLQISRSLVYTEINRGKLKARRIGTCIRLDQGDVMEYLRQATISPDHMDGGRAG
jgi:excisionase family DNA binding protein